MKSDDDHSRFVAWSPAKRRHVEVGPETELGIGTTVIRLYYLPSSGAFVTVPGASEYSVTPVGLVQSDRG